jgi:hypothetical protein
MLLRVQSGGLRVNDACVVIGLQPRQVFPLLRGLDQDTASRPRLDIEADELVMLKVAAQRTKSASEPSATKTAFTDPLERFLLATICALRGRRFGATHQRLASSLVEVPTPMLLNGGYGYGWFRFLAAVPFDDRF